MRRAVVGVLALVAAVVVAVLPRALTPDKRDIVIFMGLYTIVGAGLTLLMGFAGQVSLGQGEFLSLLGPSGCGKTTALRLVAGFDRPDAGRIVVDGKDVTRVSPSSQSKRATLPGVR